MHGKVAGATPKATPKAIQHDVSGQQRWFERQSQGTTDPPLKREVKDEPEVESNKIQKPARTAPVGEPTAAAAVRRLLPPPLSSRTPPTVPRIRPPKFQTTHADPSQQQASSERTPPPPTAQVGGGGISSGDVPIPMSVLHEVVAAASSAAASAAAEAVMLSFARAYSAEGFAFEAAAVRAAASAESQTGGAPAAASAESQTELTCAARAAPVVCAPAVRGHQPTSKKCAMLKAWGCGAQALAGEDGWVHTNNGGWRRVCSACKEHVLWQTRRGGEEADDSSDS